MNVSRCIVLESGTPLRSADRELGADAELWKRIALLGRDDQILLELSLRGGASHRQIGRLLNRSPGSVSRRLHRLGRRLHDPVVVALLHPSCPLEPEYRQLGVERFLCGTAMQELAGKHQLSCVRVRSILLLIRGWHRGMRGAAKERRLSHVG
jgi:hypothetical protein